MSLPGGGGFFCVAVMFNERNSFLSKTQSPRDDPFRTAHLVLGS